MSYLHDGQLPVVVIGAGIVGVCSAVSLMLDGHRVVIVDKTGPAAGASFGNAGAISPGSCVPLSGPGMLKNVPKWLVDKDGPLVIQKSYLLQVMPWLMRFIAAGRADRVEAISDALHALHSVVHESYAPLLRFAGAEALIMRSGALTVYESEAAYNGAISGWQARQRRGIRFEILRAGQIQDLVPALSTQLSHAVLQADHAYVTDPATLVTRLFEAACRDGAEFIREEVRQITGPKDAPQLELISGKVITASHVVIAAGVASAGLAKRLGLALPLEGQRGYHLHLKQSSENLPLPVSFASSKFYATPMAHGIRLAGTVEFARPGSAPDYRRAARLGVIANRWIKGLDPAGATKWMGSRPCFPDSLPVIDRVPGHPKVLLACGHGHNGMTSAPATARLISAMVSGTTPFLDPTPYRATRFTARQQ